MASPFVNRYKSIYWQHNRNESLFTFNKLRTLSYLRFVVSFSFFVLFFRNFFSTANTCKHFPKLERLEGKLNTLFLFWFQRSLNFTKRRIWNNVKVYTIGQWLKRLLFALLVCSYYSIVCPLYGMPDMVPLCPTKRKIEQDSCYTFYWITIEIELTIQKGKDKLNVSACFCSILMLSNANVRVRVCVHLPNVWNDW